MSTKPRSRKPLPELIDVPPKQAAGNTKTETAIRITLFRRAGSRFRQALIVWQGRRKRLTTRATIKASAEEYAHLAYRHFSAESRKPGFAATFPPKLKANAPQ